MKFILLALLLTACASGHQANIAVRDGHAEPQAATLQQPVEPVQQPVPPVRKPVVRKQQVVIPQPVKSEQSSPLPKKKNESNIEED